MNTSVNLHVDGEDAIDFYAEAGGRITVTVGSGRTLAWLHLSSTAARRLSAVLALAVEPEAVTP